MKFRRTALCSFTHNQYTHTEQMSDLWKQLYLATDWVNNTKRWLGELRTVTSWKAPRKETSRSTLNEHTIACYVFRWLRVPTCGSISGCDSQASPPSQPFFSLPRPWAILPWHLLQEGPLEPCALPKTSALHVASHSRRSVKQCSTLNHPTTQEMAPRKVSWQAYPLGAGAHRTAQEIPRKGVRPAQARTQISAQ